MRKWILLLIWIGSTFSAVAQLDTKLYRSETKIDSLDQGKWLVELDNITFSRIMNTPEGYRKVTPCRGFGYSRS